jgi:hypothetical protein
VSRIPQLLFSVAVLQTVAMSEEQIQRMAWKVAAKLQDECDLTIILGEPGDAQKMIAEAIREACREFADEAVRR